MPSDLRSHLEISLGGAYAFERELGGGGMSHVFVAEDRALGRRVVVKVLRPELAAGTSAERFRHEIAVAARLQHPLVVPLLAAGELEGGLLYYTMPFVDGEALRQRLAREGALPIADAAAILRDVLEALAYAHARGVVHRDIKPDNILLSGRHAMVADFGVARAIAAAGGGSVTSTGVAIGTPAYMAPEQAAADDTLDHRADLYSAGVVAYEMLAGSAPFSAHSPQALLAAQMTRAPDPITIYREHVPPALAALVMRLLEKHPADRPQTAEAALGALDAWVPFADPVTPSGRALAPSASVPAVTPASISIGVRSVTGHAKRSLRWLLVSLLAASISVLAWRAGRARPADHPVTRFEVVGPELEGVGNVLIARDGSLLVYAGRGAPSQLFVRRMDDLAARPILGTEGASLPFLSPDARWVAFFAGGALKKVPVAGGSPVTLASAVGGHGGTWGPNDIIVFGDSGMLKRVPAAGGSVTLVARPDTAMGERTLRSPSFLPDGKAVLYSTGWVLSPIGVVTLAGQKSVVTRDSLANPQFVPPGYLLGQRDGQVLAFPFSLRRRAITGPGLAVASVPDVSPFSVSDNGSAVFIQSSTDSRLVSVNLDRGGRVDTLLSEPRRFFSPRLSPDGRRLAVSAIDGIRTDIWLFSLEDGTLQRLTFRGQNEDPEWSPDGRRILFNEDFFAEDIFWVEANGSKPPEPLVTLPGVQAGASWTPDGRRFVFRNGESGGHAHDIMLASIDSPGTPHPLLVSPFSEFAPRVSPDGRWLVYASNESGRSEIYVRSFPDMGGKTQVSVDGGREPLWSRDSRQLFYRSDRQFIAARIILRPTFHVIGRQLLFEGVFNSRPYHTDYDVSKDGRRLILLEPSVKDRHLFVIVNWATELDRRFSHRK